MKTFISEPDAGTRLIADIGGTNARFALSSGADAEPRHVVKLATADYPDLVTAARAYIDLSGEPLPRHMCIALAGPVDGDHISLTNNHWSFAPATIREELALESLRIINDFEAMAWAVSACSKDDCVQIGGGAALTDKPMCVIGPGTGFGAALLVPGPQQNPVVFGTEGGHCSVAACDDREAAVCNWLRQQNIYPSRESLLSGTGLQNIYNALRAIDQRPPGPRSAADIQESAIEGADDGAREALEIFCALLGTAAGDQALGCGALGGMYITGGIVRRFIPFLQSSRFRERFDNHRPMQRYLQSIPVYVVTAEHQGLKGAVLAL